MASLGALEVETPITAQNGFLIIRQCRPHDCGEKNAMVVIDQGEDRMWVGFFSRSPTLVSTRWFGSTDHRTLPDTVLREFDAQHEP